MSDDDSVITVDELDETTAEPELSLEDVHTGDGDQKESNGSRMGGVGRGNAGDYRAYGGRPGQPG